MLDMVNSVTRRNIINHIHRLRDMTWLALGMGMLDLNVSNQYIRWSSKIRAYTMTHSFVAMSVSPSIRKAMYVLFAISTDVFFSVCQRLRL